MAVDHIGAYLGPGYTSLSVPQVNVTPQISNPAGNFLTDTANWVKISGLFTAAGGEHCIMLGNFEPYAGQSTLLISGSANNCWPLYFIDDV